MNNVKRLKKEAMIKDGYRHWQPEFFPQGTVVKIRCLKRVDGVLQHCHYDEDPAQVTVRCLVNNSVGSWLIRTGEQNKPIGIEHSVNTDHVVCIVKRGDGPMVYDTSVISKVWRSLSTDEFHRNKNKYYFHAAYDVIIQQIDLVLGHNAFKLMTYSYRNTVEKELLMQSFVKKVKHPYDVWYTVYEADKKRLRRYVRQNINRWRKSMRQLLKEKEKNDMLEYEREMNQFDEGIPIDESVFDNNECIVINDAAAEQAVTPVAESHYDWQNDDDIGLMDNHLAG